MPNYSGGKNLVPNGPGIYESISSVSDYWKKWPSGIVFDFEKYVWNVEIFNPEPTKCVFFYEYFMM